jgi:uncharacterized membrane protein
MMLTVFDSQLEKKVTYNKTAELLLIILCVVLLAAEVGVMGWKVSLGQLPFVGMTYTFSSLVLVHNITVQGWRRALAFFSITVVVSFLFEYVGATTGIVFGHYVYTDVLGLKILGVVPVVIPLAYYMVIYPSAQMANLLLRGKVNPRQPSVFWSLYAALLAALIMTAWDLVLDPVMVLNVKAWKWLQPGYYFAGVPFQNFVGWVITTFTIGSLYRLVEPGIQDKPYGRGHRFFLLLPMLGYSTLMFGDLFLGVPLDTRVMAPFVMGIPFLAATMRLYAPEADTASSQISG